MRSSASTQAPPSSEAAGEAQEQDSFVVIDGHDRIVLLNPAARRLFGCGVGEGLPGDLTRFIPDWRRIREARPPVASVDLARGALIQGVKADGGAFAARLWVHPLSEFGASPVMATHACLVMCPPDQEPGDSAQVESFRRSVLALFDMAPVPTWVTEGERIVFANRACMVLFGVSDLQEIVGKSLYELLHRASHDHVRQALGEALASDGCVPTLTGRIERADGSHRDVFMAMAALPDHGRTTAQMAITDITAKTQEFEAMERSQKRMKALSTELVHAREEERRRIARELHDELGQRLSALKMELASLVPTLRRRAQDERIVSLIGMVDETVESVRRMATELRPLMLDDLGLVPAIETLVRESERRMGIVIALDMDERLHAVNEPVAIATYRIVQEALTNVFRHAHATFAKVDIHVDDQNLRITVQDDGQGFSEQSMGKDGSQGLRGMRERAHLLGGQIQITPSELGGGAVTVCLPLAQTAEATQDRTSSRLDHAGTFAFGLKGGGS